MMRILGIDWGEERIGLALGDDETRMASPLATVNSIEELLDLAQKEGVEMLVIGKPTKLSGKDEHMDAYKEFCGRLEADGSFPVAYYDERLTSKAADALAGDKKTKAGRDEIAAMLILNDYLNSNSHGSDL